MSVFESNRWEGTLVRELSRRAFTVTAALIAVTTLIGACAPKDRADDAGSTLRIAYFTEDAMNPSWNMHGKFLVSEPRLLNQRGRPKFGLAFYAGYGLSVHPDGTRLAFTAGTEGRSEAWVLRTFLPAIKQGNGRRER